VRATRSLPLGAVDLLDVLLFLHAIDAEPELRRDDHLDLWRPYVEAVLSGTEGSNPTLAGDRIPASGRGLAAHLASLRAYFRVGVYWWERTGIPRRWIVQAEGASRLRLARYVLTQLGGFRPVWWSHLPQLPAGRHLTPDAFLHAHVEVARRLQHAPEIRGIASASWYYDPALHVVSPHLGFLRDTVAQNGGLLFEVPRDSMTREHALATSRARRGAAASGLYEPRNFARVWGRSPFLAWSERQEGWQLSMTIGA
jgi:hypothetical protein